MSGTQTFEVRNLVFASGERFPVLIDGDTGVPDFEVTLYVLTQLRTRNLSASTLTAATRSVMFGCQVLEYVGVNLQNRINQGKLLEPGEFDRLMDSFFWTQEKLREALSQSTEKPAPNRVLSLESVRKSVPALDNSQTINADTAATRLIYFRDFLKWKVDRSLFALTTTHENYQGLTSAKEFMVGAINARMPKGSAKNDLDARQGLSSEETVLLLESVKLDSDRNPWKSEFIRVRNRLIVHLLLNLGLRKGELLGIKVGDMNLEKNELTIHRRADDFEDPRSIQPNAKTNSRILYVDQELASALHAYVVKYRQAVDGARRHPFLFVANGSGAPMSIAALDVVFSDIRNKFPSKFERLSAHILRHTWNDKFSEVMDKHGVGEAKEEEARSYAMGWKSGSGTAKVYTRRHVRKKANEVSLELQARFSSLDKQ